MQSRRDQVDAQSHLLGRLTGALVRAEPDGLEPPTRRDNRAVIIGVVAGLLGLGIVAGWALISGNGSTAWQQAGTLIVDKSTGSRFLLLGGELRPVMNIASAKLLVGSNLTTATVPTSRLKKVPRGAPIGIVGAPDMLPQKELVNQGVWRACMTTPIPAAPAADTTATSAQGAALVQGAAGAPSPDPSTPPPVTSSGVGGLGGLVGQGIRPVPDGTGETSGGATGSGGAAPQGPPSSAGSNKAGTVIEIGAAAETDRVGAGEAVLVAVGARQYLIWQDQRLTIERAWAADVLGFGSVEPVQVTAQWLDLIPAGPRIASVTLGQAGGAGPVIGGRAAPIGQIFRSDAGGGSVTHYLTLADGLAPLSATEYALASAEPKSPAELPISAAALAQAKRVALPRTGGKLPDTPPAVRPLGADESVCLEYPNARNQKVPDVVRHQVPDVERQATGTTGIGISVTPGGGALVGTNPAVAPKDQDQVLIDDNGTVYPLTSDAREALGFSAEQAVIVPTRWLLLLPRGPLLSTAGKG